MKIGTEMNENDERACKLLEKKERKRKEPHGEGRIGKGDGIEIE